MIKYKTILKNTRLTEYGNEPRIITGNKTVEDEIDTDATEDRRTRKEGDDK